MIGAVTKFCPGLEIVAEITLPFSSISVNILAPLSSSTISTDGAIRYPYPAVFIVTDVILPLVTSQDAKACDKLVVTISAKPSSLLTC